MLKTGVTQIYHDPVINGFNDLKERSQTHHLISQRKTKTQHSLLTHYLLFAEVEKRGVNDPILRTDLMLLLVNAPRLLALREPGLFRKSKLVPAEGEAKRRVQENSKLSARYLYEIQVRITELAKAKKLPPETVEKNLATLTGSQIAQPRRDLNSKIIELLVRKILIIN